MSNLRVTFNKTEFNFNANLETPNLYPARGKIKYRVGVGLKKKRENRFIVFNGSWKFSRSWGLIFEADYGEGRVSRFYFSSVLNLITRDKIIFSIYNRDRRPLGMSITFKAKDLKRDDFEYFPIFIVLFLSR